MHIVSTYLNNFVKGHPPLMLFKFRREVYDSWRSDNSNKEIGTQKLFKNFQKLSKMKDICVDFTNQNLNKILGTIKKIHQGLISMLQRYQKCIAWNPSK